VQHACKRAKLKPAPDSTAVDLLRALAGIYDAMFTQRQPFARSLPGGLSLSIIWDIAQPVEKWLLTTLQREITVSNLLDASAGVDGYILSVRRIIDNHPAATHRLYENIIARECSVEGLSFYLHQESTLDPYFDDLLANLQVGASVEAKAEIGENYYDEIGRGRPAEAHSRLFAHCARVLSSRVKAAHELLPESLLCGNLSVCLAVHREYYPIAVGYFGATEDLSPRRFLKFLQGWERCGLPSEDAKYQQLHVQVDTEHADGWWRNVAFPSSQQSKAFKKSVELGILIRLETSARYLNALSDALTPYLN
jgi:hypothetical protein